MIDRSKAGNFAMEAIENMAESVDDENIGAELGEMMLVAEIKFPRGTVGNDDDVYMVTTYCSDSRTHFQMGMNDMARAAILNEEED